MWGEGYLLTTGLHCAIHWVDHCMWAPHPPAASIFRSFLLVWLGSPQRALGSVSPAANIPGATWEGSLGFNWSACTLSSNQPLRGQLCLASPRPDIFWSNFSASPTLVFCCGWGEGLLQLHGTGRACGAHCSLHRFSNSPPVGSTCTSYFPRSLALTLPETFLILFLFCFVFWIRPSRTPPPPGAVFYFLQLLSQVALCLLLSPFQNIVTWLLIYSSL